MCVRWGAVGGCGGRWGVEVRHPNLLGWGMGLLPLVQCVCGAPSSRPAPVHLGGVRSKCDKHQEKC